MILKEEFVIFVMLYAANIDGQVHKKEEALIRELFDAKLFDKVREKFDKYSDYESLEIIQSCKDYYYPTKEDLQLLLEDIKKMFLADDKFSNLEQASLNILEKILL